MRLKIKVKVINILCYWLFLIPVFAEAQDSLKYLKRTSYLSDNPRWSVLDMRIDSIIKSFMQSPQNCGISVGISIGGINSFYNYGEIKRGSKAMPDQNTLYEIGSISKTFCGLLLANAVVEKKIKLNDDIRKYLPGKYPDLVLNKKPILIKHLANHTSGLPRIPENMLSQPDFDSLNPYKHYTKQMMFNYLKVVKLTSEPGTICDYSNLGMALLGIILEGIYDRSFDDLVKEKICSKNQMMNTGIAMLPGKENQLADGYNEDGVNTPHWDLGIFSAAGGIRSSTEDMIKYLNYNLNEQDTVTKLAHEVTYTGRETVALSWFIKKTKQGNMLTWHNGGTYGFSSFSGFIKEKNCSVIILSNSGTNVDYIGIAILNYLQR